MLIGYDGSVGLFSVVAELCKEGRLFEAIRVVHHLKPMGICVSMHIFHLLLEGCIKNKDVSIGREVHSLIVQNRLESNTFLGSYLIRMFGLFGSLLEVQLVFRKLVDPNIFAWSEIIVALVRCGEDDHAIDLYSTMLHSLVQPDGHVYVAVLRACASVVALCQGRCIHSHIVENGYDSDVFIGNTIIDMYVKGGFLEDAQLVFDNLMDRDVVSWGAIIAGYSHHGLVHEALQLFHEMQQEGVEANNVTWNAIISGYAQHGPYCDALCLFKKMQDHGKKPDNITYVGLLQACSHMAGLDVGKLIHADIIENSLGLEILVRSALIDMYAKCGSLNDAFQVFNSFSDQNAVTWSAMIAAFALHSKYEMALQYFEGMQQENLRPTEVTYVCLLSACSHMGLVDKGFHHFNSMEKDHGITPTLEHYNCMLDLVGRVGCFNEANALLERMPCQPNIVGWTSLLNSCRIYGNVEFGVRCCEQIVSLDCRDASGFMLMSCLYENVCMWDNANKFHELRKSVNAWKKAGNANVEISGKVHTFIIGDKSHTENPIIHVKLARLTSQMKEEGHLPDLDSVPLPVS